jgi:outer membrane biosynthesis protein TonB
VSGVGISKVFGTGGSSPTAGAGAGGKTRLGRREQLMLGGAAVVGLLAVLARSRSGGDTTSEDAAAPAGTAGQYELDTSNTDFYNELQPELEALSDRLDGVPKAVVDQLAQQQKPAPPKAAPKPPKKKKKPRPPKHPKKKPPAKKPGKPRR